MPDDTRDDRVRPYTAAMRSYVTRSLEQIETSVAAMRHLLPDVEVVAYDRPQTGEPSTTTQPRSTVLAEQGDRRAKLALAAVADRRTGVPHIEDLVRALEQQLQAVFRGPGAASDDDCPPTMTASDMAHALNAQERRRERGDYVPQRSERQPTAPKLRGQCACRSDHRHSTAHGTRACRVCGCLVPPKEAA